MAKVRRAEVVAAALELLDEAGLDAVTTRRLAQRLGVESPTLYWHFRDKAALFAEMAATALARHHVVEVPRDPKRWADWFADNARSFRRSLLAHRDGARLHAGTVPGASDLARLAPKVAYLVRAGLDERKALMALLTVGQFTIGCVLEEQARIDHAPPTDTAALEVGSEAETLGADVVGTIAAGGEATFEFGLSLILDGLRDRIGADVRRPERGAKADQQR